ncbi:MAG: tyrosine-type recombinase/integrase [Piscinibacter sp.]|nr:tyrosine-type recombinase/integrase [Piscinibacter sp.]
MKYRHGGKEKRLSLGTFPDTSLRAARVARDKARQQIAAGIDPSSERKAAKQAARLATLNTLERWPKRGLHRSKAWTTGTRAMITASLENDVFPTLGSRPIGDIQAREIRDVVQQIEARGAGETAGRVFQRLRSIYRYAVAHDLAAVDPTYPLKPSEIFKPRKTRHRASLSEREVPGFLAKLETYDGDPATKLALKLLMFTATRPGELRGARWDEIDERAALWRIPASRMKMKSEHSVPLSKQAGRLLSTMRKMSGNGQLVFPSPFYPDKPLSDGTLNSALARLGYKGIATAHGFRTLFSTCANEAGWNADVIRSNSLTKSDEVRDAYNRAQWMAERTKLMQVVGSVDKLAQGED